MSLFPGPNSFLIWDNCKIHIGAKITELANRNHIIMIYLPPYSPDFNPIEKVFACFKMRLQRKRTLTGRESDADKIEDCLRQVATPTLIRSFYRDCGYLN
jgi:transposase